MGHSLNQPRVLTTGSNWPGSNCPTSNTCEGPASWTRFWCWDRWRKREAMTSSTVDGLGCSGDVHKLMKDLKEQFGDRSTRQGSINVIAKCQHWFVDRSISQLKSDFSTDFEGIYRMMPLLLFTVKYLFDRFLILFGALIFFESYFVMICYAMIVIISSIF